MLPKGVEVRGDAIRVNFTYRGQRCRETIKGMKATKANIAYAARKKATIEYEIERGLFDYADHFPHSKKRYLFSDTRSDKTIGQALDEYLRSKKHSTAESTYRGYKSKADTHIKPKWGRHSFRQISQSDLDGWIAVDLSHLSNKTINDVLIIVRALFNSARKDKIISETLDIENLPIHIPPPDPFTRDEIKRIMAVNQRRRSELNAVEFDFWAGLRVSELIALGWDDIDLAEWEANVCRAVVRGNYKKTKTTSGLRSVELITPAIEALKRQKELTFMLPPIEIKVTQEDNKTIKKEQWKPVFINTNTGKPFDTDNQFRDRFFSFHLKKAKVRYRGPKHCRDTFASQMLTAGLPLEWIANQMGHASTRTLEKRYAKWIKEDALPMAKIASERLGFAENTVQNGTNTPQILGEKRNVK